MYRLVWLAAALAAAYTWCFMALARPPLGSGFTYQGDLKVSGTPLTGTADFEFSLWDAEGSGSPPVGGTQIGATQTLTSVSVADGVFTVVLNAGGEFGTGAFMGDARWLQIAVRSPAGSGAYTTLAPRQAVTAAPYALFAAKPWETTPSGLVYFGGKVGIGTASPAHELSVLGTVEVAKSTGGSAVFGRATAGTGATFGVRGITFSSDPLAAGLYGEATAGMANGLWATTTSIAPYTTGAWVEALGASGETFGLYADNLSSFAPAAAIAGVGSGFTPLPGYPSTAPLSLVPPASVFVAFPGVPRAAALRIEGGAITVKRANPGPGFPIGVRPAGSIDVKDWTCIHSWADQDCPFGTFALPAHWHSIGAMHDDHIFNPLIKPDSYIYLTVFGDPGPWPAAFSQVRFQEPGHAVIRTAIMGTEHECDPCPGGLPMPPTHPLAYPDLKVRYLIINPLDPPDDL